jgi:hypothetical protein
MFIYSTMTERGYTVAILTTAVLVITALSSCNSRDTAEVRNTVERFVTALHEGDREAVARLAPSVRGDTRLEQVFSALAKYSSWSITEIVRRGGSARAYVNLVTNGQETEVVIPLSLVGGTWTVDNRILVTTELDFVPLEK